MADSGVGCQLRKGEGRVTKQCGVLVSNNEGVSTKGAPGKNRLFQVSVLGIRLEIHS